MSNFEAHHRFARITARKARYVADLIRGHDVNTALDVLRHTHRRGSSFLTRILRSAIANATREGDVNANRLYIRELQIDAGPLLQGRFRYQSGPMGRALPIRKRTSHIHMILAERAGERDSRGGKAAQAAADAPETGAPEKGKGAEARKADAKKTAAKAAPKKKSPAKAPAGK